MFASDSPCLTSLIVSIPTLCSTRGIVRRSFVLVTIVAVACATAVLPAGCGTDGDDSQFGSPETGAPLPPANPPIFPVGDAGDGSADGGCATGKSCGDAGVCAGNVCCDAKLACGDVCCGGGQVCSFQKCVV